MKNKSILILWFIIVLPGCASMLAGNMAASLSTAILNQNDPETVRAGAPAYLLMIDGMIQDNPNDPDILLTGSRLYGAYATIFVEDRQRAERLARKSFGYAVRAICQRNSQLCSSYNESFDIFAGSLKSVTKDDLAYLYGFGSSWAGLVQVSAGDWGAMADLPKIELTMQRIVSLDESFDNGSAHTYLGVLSSLRPASLGGKPEQGRMHFEKAIQLSGGKNLMNKVLYARHYARLVYDRNLHDRLLREVIEADPEVPGLTLVNTLARQEADELLKSADEYF
jgi:hypothetical protein